MLKKLTPEPRDEKPQNRLSLIAEYTILFLLVLWASLAMWGLLAARWTV